MKTTPFFNTTTKDNAAFALALGAAAIAMVTLFANNVSATPKTTHVAAIAEVQMLDTIVVTAPRIHTVQLETIVVTASRYTSNDNIIVATK